jgi:SEC-C motif-containing protein
LANCCGRFMGVAETPALDPESLMRSRYSAFVLERADYLLATWHPRTRPAQLEFEPGARWLGLAVKRHQSTGPDAAVVEFVARYRVGGKAVRLHEVSRFEREAGRWWYLDGEQR